MFNYSSTQGLHCYLSRDFSHFAPFTWVFVALNIASSITATLGNALILVALREQSSLNPPSKLLLRCMAFSDLGIGLLVQPAAVVSFLFAIYQRWNFCLRSSYIWNFVTVFLSGFSIASIIAISVDRHLALILGIRYRQVVTIKRTKVVVALLFIVSTAYCLTILISYNVFIIVTTIIWSLWLTISTYCYTRIHRTLKSHIQAQITPQGQPNGISHMNLLQYKNTVSTALWLFAAMIICYFPFGVILIAHAATSESVSSMMIQYFTVGLIYFNSSLNPFLYCWKIRDIRNAVKDILKSYCVLAPPIFGMLS